jgi:hypothetical protein
MFFEAASLADFSVVVEVNVMVDGDIGARLMVEWARPPAGRWPSSEIDGRTKCAIKCQYLLILNKASFINRNQYLTHLSRNHMLIL